MIETPKENGDCPGQDLHCRAALAPHVLAVAARLVEAGFAPKDATLRVIDAIRDPSPDPDDPIAAELAQISAWARNAGWGDAEVSAAMQSLAADLARSAITPVSN